MNRGRSPAGAIAGGPVPARRRDAEAEIDTGAVAAGFHSPRGEHHVGEAALADPVRTHQRHQPAAAQRPLDPGQVAIPSDQHRLILIAERGGVRFAIRRQENWADKAIAAARHVDDVAGAVAAIAQRLAQGREVDAKTDLLHHGGRPDLLLQHVLFDQFPRLLQQTEEDGQGAAADTHRPAVAQKLLLARQEGEVSEVENRLVHLSLSRRKASGPRNRLNGSVAVRSASGTQAPSKSSRRSGIFLGA